MPLNLAKIKSRREKLGYTLDEAARHGNAAAKQLGWNDRVKLTRQRWYQIEAGLSEDVRLSTLESLAAVLKCKIDDLVAKS